MFSANLEMVLNVAYREAESRRHAHLTLEHLLFAIAHEPKGEDVLLACGVDLDKLRNDLKEYLETAVELMPKDSDQEPIQTLAFQRVLQKTVLHVQSSGKTEADIGDALAATLQERRSQAAKLLEAQDVSRLDILNYISHGIAKVIRPSDDDRASAGEGDEDAPSDGHEARPSRSHRRRERLRPWDHAQWHTRGVPG